MFRSNFVNPPIHSPEVHENKLITEQTHVSTRNLVETMVATGKYYSDARADIYDIANLEHDPLRMQNVDLVDVQNSELILNGRYAKSQNESNSSVGNKVGNSDTTTNVVVDEENVESSPSGAN